MEAAARPEQSADSSYAAMFPPPDQPAVRRCRPLVGLERLARLVIGALTATMHVADHRENPWWETLT
jgi:hypothetical protein